MEIKYSYSQAQLDNAIKFISKHNPSFRRKNQIIKDEILSSIERIVPNFGAIYSGTMGFILVTSREYEDIDNNFYSCHIEILVDASLGVELDDDDLVELSMESSISGLDQ